MSKLYSIRIVTRKQLDHINALYPRSRHRRRPEAETMTLAIDAATNIIFGVLATVLTAATIVVAMIKHRRASKWNNGESFASPIRWCVLLTAAMMQSTRWPSPLQRHTGKEVQDMVQAQTIFHKAKSSESFADTHLLWCDQQDRPTLIDGVN